MAICDGGGKSSASCAATHHPTYAAPSAAPRLQWLSCNGAKACNRPTRCKQHDYANAPSNAAFGIPRVEIQVLGHVQGRARPLVAHDVPHAQAPKGTVFQRLARRSTILRPFASGCSSLQIEKGIKDKIYGATPLGNAVGVSQAPRPRISHRG